MSSQTVARVPGLRDGFARLLPVAVLIGLAIGTTWLLSKKRPVPASAARPRTAIPDSLDTLPVRPTCIRDAHGRLWRLADLKPGAVLVGADLRYARWRGLWLEGIAFRHCDFRGADLRGTTLMTCDLRGSRFERAIMRGSNVGMCRMAGADFTNADLQDTKLMGPALAGSFRGANLDGAFIYGIEEGSCDPIRDPDLHAVCYDRATRWPAGLNPRAYGARLVE